MPATMQPSRKSIGDAILTMTTQDAYIGLHLDDNWELADALEMYITGFIDCAESNVCGLAPCYSLIFAVSYSWALARRDWGYVHFN